MPCKATMDELGQVALTGRERARYNLGDVALFDLDNALDEALDAIRSPEAIASACGMIRALGSSPYIERAVYFIGVTEEPDVCKIGIARDPVARFDMIKGYHYRELYLHGVAFCPQGGAQIIERSIIHMARDVGLLFRGEWLKMAPTEVAESALVFARSKSIAVCDGKAWFDSVANWTKELMRKKRRNH